MNSKERIRAALAHKLVDRTPAALEAVSVVCQNLIRHLSVSSFEEVLTHYQIDTRYPSADYVGPPLTSSVDTNGSSIQEDYWGTKYKYVWSGREYNTHCVYRPLDEAKTLEDIRKYRWPRVDWFDFEGFKRKLDCCRDKAIIIGHPGPFQVATFLRSMDLLFMDMALAPDLAHAVYDGMAAFELEFYERLLIAGDGQIDILRPHDDYGTQRGLLFSVPMWHEFFAENTKKLTALAHKYGAYYMQHSCGAVREIIPGLIECGVDALEPIQKVVGMEPEGLKRDFGHRLAFHGGIDTQDVLPFGTPGDVRKETEHFIRVLGMDKTGYILMSSQSIEGDVPMENIDAMYIRRKVKLRNRSAVRSITHLKTPNYFCRVFRKPFHLSPSPGQYGHIY